MAIRARIQQRPLLAFGLGLFILLFLFMWPVLWPAQGQALGGLDMRGLFYPWFGQAKTAVLNGRLPLWDASQFAGYPFLSNPQVALFYPPTWLVMILPLEAGISWFVLLHLWLAGMGMFLFVRALAGSHFAATLAGLALAFSGFVSVRVWAGHIGLVATDAWLPWLLLTFLWSVQKRSSWAGIIAGVPFGLAILAGHTTSLLYVGIIWAAFALYLGVTTHAWRIVVRQFLFAVFIGLLLSAIQLLPLLQFTMVSSRAGAASLEFSTAFSFPPAHLVTLFVPTFFGEPLVAGYWSVPNFEELTYYIGLLPWFGLVLGLRKPNRAVIFYLLLMGIGLLLAFGSYGFLYGLLYNLLPPFRLARAPARAMFLFVFAGIGLLATAVTIWERHPDKQALNVLMRWVLAIGFVVGITVLAATGAVFMSQHPSDTSGRLWQQAGGWATAVLIFLLSGLLLWAYLSTTDQRRKFWFGAALLLVLLVDLWTFGSKFVRLESMQPDQLWSDTVDIIGSPSERVLPWGISIFSQNGAGQVGLNSVFGYNALEIGTNVGLTASVPDPRSTAYDILSAKYVVATVPLEQYVDGQRPLTLVGQQNNTWVYERARSLPLVRLVTHVEIIADDQSAINRIHQPDFNPATTAILAAQPPCELNLSDNPGTAVINEQADGFWEIKTQSEVPSLLILSETDYPGWQVTIDGATAESLTAYTTIRAVCVPAGEHIVLWQFMPTVYWWGGLLTLLGLILVAAAVVKMKR